jgi:hypothetical protein
MKLTYFAFHPGGSFEKSFCTARFLSAREKLHRKNNTKQHLVLCLNHFSNINSFASNNDILKILKLT